MSEDPRITRARHVVDGRCTTAFVQDAVAAYDDLLIENERLRSACQTLGKVVEAQCQSALEAIGERLGGDIIDETGDGDWGLVWERLAELGGKS